MEKIKTIIFYLLYGGLCFALGLWYGTTRDDGHTAITDITDGLEASKTKQCDNIERIKTIEGRVNASENRLRGNNQFIDECEQITQELLRRAESKDT